MKKFRILWTYLKKFLLDLFVYYSVNISEIAPEISFFCNHNFSTLLRTAENNTRIYNYLYYTLLYVIFIHNCLKLDGNLWAITPNLRIAD